MIKPALVIIFKKKVDFKLPEVHIPAIVILQKCKRQQKHRENRNIFENPCKVFTEQLSLQQGL